MKRDWTFTQKLAAGFSIAALTVVVVAFLGYGSTSRLIDNQHWASHSLQVRTTLATLLLDLKDAEAGQRGYVITGGEDFLASYRQALPMIQKEYSLLRSLTSDNDIQQRHLDDLRPLLEAKDAEMAKATRLRQTGGVAAASQFISQGLGKSLMDQVRGVLNAMDQEEQGLYDQRNAETEASAQSAKLVILWGGLLGMAFTAVVGWFIARSVRAQVGSAVQHIQGSSAELQASANQQASGSKEQSTAMNEITTTINELLATSRQIAESAQRVSQIAGNTAKSARVGDLTVEKAQESIAGIRRQVDLIVNHMLDLGRKSQQIGGVLEIINELAEQTNILAINATIEAAGAGEAGKRFAVVADEIRKLADRVGGSTKEIRGLIEEVRSSVNATVMTTEGGAKAVDAGERQFAEVASAFRQIGEMVVTTTDAAREIELSTKQQATAVEHVNLAVTNVAQAAKETETSSAQTLQTATELNHLSRALSQMVTAAAGA